jgi:alkylated DNA repair protein (DNA oxidative demethylase)
MPATDWVKSLSMVNVLKSDEKLHLEMPMGCWLSFETTVACFWSSSVNAMVAGVDLPFASTGESIPWPRLARASGSSHAGRMGATSNAASPEAALPSGFLLVPDLVTPQEERALVAWFAASPAWKEVTFRGQIARRRAMSFGARYLVQGKRLTPAPPLPPALAVYRDRMIEAACARLGEDLVLAGRTAANFALCTALCYPPGGAIGWHMDNRVFGPTVLSLSLGAPARLQLRPAEDDGAHGPRLEVPLAPRSLFVLAGQARSSWHHRLCPVRAERYSLTVRAPAAAAER